MNRKDLKELIKNVINTQENDKKNFSEWDSLAHLSILMELEKRFPNKIIPINRIAEARTTFPDTKKFVSSNFLTISKYLFDS